MAEFELKALITGVDKLSPALSSMQKKIKGFQKGVKSSGLGDFSVGDLIGGGAFAAPFIAGAKAAIDFESQMADVRKVVDFDTPKQFAEMGEDILKMSDRLPMAANDIAKLVAAGGQAGIAREDLKQFAEDALKMGVAFDQSADQSGDMMAKWRTSFKMTQEEVVSLADKINYLSNNGAANAQQISDIVTRIGPLGAVAGIASGQIAALGATLAGVGVEQEVAATGIKNFMLAITGGSKQQQEAFQFLGFNSKKLAADMQKDAQGTMLKVLESISKLDKARQPKALNALFGKESIGAIAPLLTNLDLLKKNFNMVGDASQYTGSMQKEYEARAATTANQLQLLRNQATHAGVALGNALLPQINASAAGLMPLIQKSTDFVSRNPAMVRALLGAAAGFVALRVAVAGVSMALKVMSFVASASPIGLIIRGIALAAGLLIANWDVVGPFFKNMWEAISPYFATGWELFKTVFGWTPLGLIINNWGPVVKWFQDMWEAISPYFATGWELFKTVFGWTPLGLIINNWGPVVKWFQDMWEKLKPIIEWFTDGASDASVSMNASPYGAGGYGMYGSGTPYKEYNQYSINKSQSKPEATVTVDFKNAPAGMNVTGTKSSGIDVNHDVGYTRIGRTGMGG